MSDVEASWFTDKDLKKRWRCSAMKLYRLRQSGKLRSIKIGGCGAWLTSAEEIARIERPPDIKQRPAPKVAAEGNGPRDASAGNQSNHSNRRIESIPQASRNGGA